MSSPVNWPSRKAACWIRCSASPQAESPHRRHQTTRFGVVDGDREASFLEVVEGPLHQAPELVFARGAEVPRQSETVQFGRNGAIGSGENDRLAFPGDLGEFLDGSHHPGVIEMGVDVGEHEDGRLVEVLDPLERPGRVAGPVLGILLIPGQPPGRRPRPDGEIEVPGGVPQQTEEARLVLGLDEQQRVARTQEDA